MDGTYKEPETANVVGVQFSIMSPEEIRERSVVEVTTHETYDKDTPVIKGLFDIRMGTTDMGKVCGTCGQTDVNCPGHFGHINLARPVYHYQFMTTIQKILRCTCIQCSKLLVNKESAQVKTLLKKNNKVRWAEIYALSQKINRCGQETDDGCGAKQPDKIKVEGMDLVASWKELGKTQHLIVEQVKSIFERITDEDVNVLGFSESWCRPEWFICSVFPVAPPSVRPSAKQDDSQRMDDDLTHKLSDIVKWNNTLSQKINSNSRPEVIDNWTKILQYHIATFVDNELPGIAQAVHRSGRPLKALRQRLKGKDGRIRSNLMGKRVDYSGRSVITPDPNIELDELGCPFAIAKNLTYPEIVNQYTKEKLTNLLNNGVDTYPCIKSIERDSLKITITKSNHKDIVLQEGDVVRRQLLDGDYVLFNRQPSLHRMSMMAHRVRVMKGNTFRLNVSVTPPYNADFDGDEMNVHVPQSVHAVTELMNIASVNYQIISPRSNKPIIAIVQDTLLGIHKLTRGEKIQMTNSNPDGYYYSNNTNVYPRNEGNVSGDVKTNSVDTSLFTKSQMMNLLCDLSTFDGTLPEPTRSINDIPLWTGRSILSYIIPNNVNLSMENASYDSNPDDFMNKILIQKGEIMSGGFDKNAFSKTSKGLVHTIYNDLGEKRAKDFIDDLQKIVTYFLLIEGFSVGIGDMIADDETTTKINSVIQENKKNIDKIMQEIHLDVFENFSGQSNHDYFESKVNDLLNKTLTQTESMGLESLDPKNRVTTMVNCGSKGKPTNVSQIIACLGQQNVDGKRIPDGFIDRTLPHYSRFDDSSEARGFVENSFITGQTPQEYFFHAMGGREGLIDTAVKTSETGYIQRKLIKSMEDLFVDYDYSVRNSSGCIVQFIYGEDGMDGLKVEAQTLKIMSMDTKKIGDTFMFPKRYAWTKAISKEAYKSFKKVKDSQSIFENQLRKILEYKEFMFENFHTDENSVNYPIHIQRILTNFCLKEEPLSTMSPIDILNQNEALKEKLYVSKQSPNNQLMHMLIDIHLHPKILIEEYKIQKEEYAQVITVIEQTFYKSMIHPGEMVGAISAQSIGEPATQMTLNTFHFAGVSAKSNVTRGIPRLRELLGVTKNLKSPSTVIYLKDDFSENQNKSQYVKNKLEYTVLKDVITKSQIYYDPKNTMYQTEIEEDRGILEIYKDFLDMEYGEDYDFEQTSPWVIRFTFNKEYMMENGIVMEDIYLSLMNYDNERIQFVYSDDNSKELIGRVSIKTDIQGQQDEDLMNGLSDQTDIISIFKNIQEDIMENVVIKGIQGITNIVMSEFPVTKLVDHEISNGKEWVLETDGVNLLEVFNSPFVNFMKTRSNDIIEIYEVLGIEAARNSLIYEITEVIDEYVNDRHIELLCDVITNKGYLTAINRQGINRGDVGPLAKCSFEDTTDQLMKAAIFGEKDKLEGVSSNIMMGQTIKSGTGMCDVLLDEEKLEECLRETELTDQDFIEVTDKNINSLLEEDEEEIFCGDEKFAFSIDN